MSAVGNQHTSRFWTEHQNDLIARVCKLYPSNSLRSRSPRNRQVSRSTGRFESYAELGVEYID